MLLKSQRVGPKKTASSVLKIIATGCTSLIIKKEDHFRVHFRGTNHTPLSHGSAFYLGDFIAFVDKNHRGTPISGAHQVFLTVGQDNHHIALCKMVSRRTV